MFKYAGVVVNNESAQVDRIFTYGIPDDLRAKIKLGMRVKVPFGMGNKFIDGFVVELIKDVESSMKIKYIKEISDDFSVLRERDMELIIRMKEKYLCTYLECIRTIIPTGITKGLKVKIRDVVYAGNAPSGKYSNELYNTIFKIVSENNGLFIKSELQKNFNISLSSLNTMIKHGFLTQEKAVVSRYDTKTYETYLERELNHEQAAAVRSILFSEKRLSLIHGVTGSGKTEIYMSLVKSVIQEDKQCIILVPEIALTPQMVERFKGRFGRDIAVFHSKLSEGERFDEWLRVKNGQVKVAIGARSAVFLPFENLGLIVIDEEHEQSYKSDSDPKYNAREVAEIRSELENCRLVLGSATPSVETFYRAAKGDFQIISLKNRADGALLPEIEVCDMREELLHGNKSMFSRRLYEELSLSLERKEQAILFLNRRGFSTFVSCRKCGYVFKCSNCDISLTFHSDSNSLSCHYCGHKERVSSNCPKCGSNYVKHFGVGTEKVEQEVNRLFPNAVTLRMDFDTTRSKNSYTDIYNCFKNKKADVLIGTQMVAKGLDFKDVTLVGVIAADLSLNLPDFRSSERTFQLITQVCGRAGRGVKRGKAIIQTYNPEDYSIKCAIENDYENFFKHEIKLRKDMDYPPFAKILNINISSEKENILINSIQRLGVTIKHEIMNMEDLIMLGPCPCGISKIKNFYRWQILVKGDITNHTAEKIKNLVYDTLKNESSNLRISLDINPNNLL